MEKLSRRNDFKTYIFSTPVGTSTLNSRTSATVPELAGANEVIVCVAVTETGSRTQIHFTKSSAITNYSEYKYARPNNADQAYSYDVQWIPASNEVNIRFNYKGASASTPQIYEVMYR